MSMLSANSIEEDEQTNQDRPRLAIAATARSDEKIIPGSPSSRKVRRLDVDEVLARSLPALGPIELRKP